MATEQQTIKKNNFVYQFLRLTCIILFLPIYLIVKEYKEPIFSHIDIQKTPNVNVVTNKLSIKLVLQKAFLLFFIFLVILPIWVTFYALSGYSLIGKLGYLEMPINISGTGSMYPTFPKGNGENPKVLASQIVSTPGMIPYPNGVVVNGKRYFGYQIGRGDIVVVEDNKIKSINLQIYGNASGWVKRLIGLPGDTIELRDGIVYLNGKPQKEPYTALAHSTFGEGFLSECKKVTVPAGDIFVMGDNRKGSGDSREIGFVGISAIKYVIPFDSQKGVLDKNWRDASKDFDESTKIKLDPQEYLRLLNEKRKEAGVDELNYQPKLQSSAEKRGEVILKYDDFSFEATRSGYTMQKAMDDVGYSNIIWGEAPIQGFYTAQELIENQFEFPQAKKFLLNKEYQDFGIAEVEGEINGCPTQVIVQHLAGYIPPNYDKAIVDSWKKALDQLKEIQPGWEKLKTYPDFYEKNKTDVDRINELISVRIGYISEAVVKMEANKWLTKDERKKLDDDSKLLDEEQVIANRLNNQHN